jgi:hypothetical protein
MLPSSAAPGPAAGTSQAAGRPRSKVIVVVVIAAVIIGITGYAVTGFVDATTRVASTDRTLKTVISHQDSLNTTFKNIDSEFGALSAGTTFNSVQARSVADEFVASATRAGITIDQDDASLAAASPVLQDRRWLTVFSQSLLDKEGRRVAHARRALSDARTIASDYVLDGRFLQAFLSATDDLDALATETSNADLSAAASTVATMKTDVDKALLLSTGPGLPPDLQALMGEFETLVADFGKLVAATQAHDSTAVNSAATTIQSDADKISAYNYDKISADIDTYFQALVADFNSQMAAATA